MTEYVRCFYCDSKITIEQLEIKDREETGITHDICTWSCPVCSIRNFSHIFKGE